MSNPRKYLTCLLLHTIITFHAILAQLESKSSFSFNHKTRHHIVVEQPRVQVIPRKPNFESDHILQSQASDVIYNSWKAGPGELCERDEGTDFFFGLKVDHGGCMIECIFLTSSRIEYIGKYLDMSRNHRINIPNFLPCPQYPVDSSRGCFNGFCQNRSKAEPTIPTNMTALGTVVFDIFNGSHNIEEDKVDGSPADPYVEIDIGSQIVSKSNVSHDTNHAIFNHSYVAKNVANAESFVIRMQDHNIFYPRHICFFKYTPVYIVSHGWSGQRRVYVGYNCQIEANITWINAF